LPAPMAVIGRPDWGLTLCISLGRPDCLVSVVRLSTACYVDQAVESLTVPLQTDTFRA